VYNSFLLEDAGSKVTLMTGVVELRNPNTKMKMMGKRKLKITAEGLLKIDFRLAFAMASMALHWLYFPLELFMCSVSQFW
jgi:hypothetical protein